MKYRFADAARAEMLGSATYYESKRAGLAKEFLTAVDDGVRRILEAPNRWPALDSEFRRYRLYRFPYGLIYRQLLDTVEIVAVMHLSRRPNYWRDRLK